MKFIKKYVKVILSVLLGLILVAIWLHYIDFSEMVTYLEQLKLTDILLAAVLYISAYFFRSLRWRALLSPTVKISPFQSYRIWMSGNFINYLIPIRAGELAKPYFVKKISGVSISKTLPSVFIDKFFDLVAIVLVVILIPFLDVELSSYLQFLIFTLATLLIIGVIILIGAVHFKNNLIYFFEKFLVFIPNKFEEKFIDMIHLFLEGIAIFNGKLKILFISLFYTTVAIFMDSLFFFVVFRAFNADIGYLKILFGYTLIYLSYILPQPPAQIGSNQVIMILIFSIGFGVNKELASAIMIFSHLLTGILISIIGIFSTSYMGVKLFTFFKEE